MRSKTNALGYTLRVRDVAAQMRVSYSYVRRLCQRGRLKHMRTGSLSPFNSRQGWYKFRQEDVDDFTKQLRLF